MLGAHCCEMFATDSRVTKILKTTVIKKNTKKRQKTKEKDKGKIIEV